MIKKRPQGESVRVTFELPSDVVSSEAAIVGDFNDWDASSHPMRYVKSRKVWSKAIYLKSGTEYQFRYLIDGEKWENDEHADDYAETPLGSQNCVIKL